MKRVRDASKLLSLEAGTLLQQVGANIREARLRRNIKLKELAERVSISHVTLVKLEKGNPSVSLGVLVRVLDVLGLVGDLALLANPDTDTVGKALAAARAPKRASTRKSREDELDF